MDRKLEEQDQMVEPSENQRKGITTFDLLSKKMSRKFD